MNIKLAKYKSQLGPLKERYRNNVILLFPIIYSPDVEPYLNKIQQLFADTTIREIFYSNFLSVTSTALTQSRESNRESPAVQLGKLVGSILADRAPEAQSLLYSDNVPSRYEYQLKIQQKVQQLTDIISKDPNFKLYHPKVGMITIPDTLLEIPVIIGTAPCKAPEVGLYLVLMGAIMSNIPLSSSENYDRIRQLLAKLGIHKLAYATINTSVINPGVIPPSIRSKLDRLAFQAKQSVYNLYKGKIRRPISGKSRFADIIIKRLDRLLVAKEKILPKDAKPPYYILPAIPDFGKLPAWHEVLRVTSDGLNKVHKCFNRVLDRNMFQQYYGSGFSSFTELLRNKLETVRIKNTANFSLYASLLIQKIDRLMSGPIRSVVDLLEPRFLPGEYQYIKNINIYRKYLNEKISTFFDDDLPNYIKDMYESYYSNNDTVEQLTSAVIELHEIINNTLNTLWNKDFDELLNIKSSGDLCESLCMARSIEAFAIQVKGITNRIDDILNRANSFIRIKEALNAAANDIVNIIRDSLINALQPNLDVEPSIVFANCMANAKSHLLKIFTSKNISKLLGKLKKQLDLDYQVPSDLKSLIRQTMCIEFLSWISVIIRFLVYYTFCKAISESLAVLRIDIESARQEALSFPNYILVIDLDMLKSLYVLMTSRDYYAYVNKLADIQDISTGSGGASGLPSEINNIFKIIGTLKLRLKIPNLVVVDRYKRTVYYRFQYMSNIAQFKL